MSILGEGIDDTDGDDNMGLIKYDPAAISRQLKDVNAFLATVNGDVVADSTKQGTQQMLKVWNTEVYGPWKAFYKDTTSILTSGPFNYLRDETFERAERFRKLGLTFRENLQKKESTGTKVTPVKVPAPIEMPDIPKGPGTGISLNPKNIGDWPWWVKVLVAGGVVGGGYYVYTKVRHTTQQKKLVSFESHTQAE